MHCHLRLAWREGRGARVQVLRLDNLLLLRKSHLLQQIHSLMREKSALAGRVEELQKRNALLLEEIEHLRAGER